jgi:hypothetical protein
LCLINEEAIVQPSVKKYEELLQNQINLV